MFAAFRLRSLIEPASVDTFSSAVLAENHSRAADIFQKLGLADRQNAIAWLLEHPAPATAQLLSSTDAFRHQLALEMKRLLNYYKTQSFSASLLAEVIAKQMQMFVLESKADDPVLFGRIFQDLIRFDAVQAAEDCFVRLRFSDADAHVLADAGESALYSYLETCRSPEMRALLLKFGATSPEYQKRFSHADVRRSEVLSWGFMASLATHLHDDFGPKQASRYLAAVQKFLFAQESHQDAEALYELLTEPAVSAASDHLQIVRTELQPYIEQHPTYASLCLSEALRQHNLEKSKHFLSFGGVPDAVLLSSLADTAFLEAVAPYLQVAQFLSQPKSCLCAEEITATTARQRIFHALQEVLDETAYRRVFHEEFLNGSEITFSAPVHVLEKLQTKLSSDHFQMVLSGLYESLLLHGNKDGYTRIRVKFGDADEAAHLFFLKCSASTEALSLLIPTLPASLSDTRIRQLTHLASADLGSSDVLIDSLLEKRQRFLTTMQTDTPASSARFQ